MSRFANADATKRFVLPGPCGCLNQPHDEDYMVLRTELGAIELAEFSASNGARRLAMIVTEWNLLDDDGKPADLDDDHFRRLYTESFESLNEWLEQNMKTETLPNGSGGHSRNGTGADRRPQTRKTPTRR